jgi:hypothetical protein
MLVETGKQNYIKIAHKARYDLAISDEYMTEEARKAWSRAIVERTLLILFTFVRHTIQVETKRQLW